MKLKNLSILFMSLVLTLIVGTTQTYAQDHPDTTSSHKHKMMGKGHKHMMKMKDSTSSHKMMEGHKMHDMKKDTMHKDESSKHEHKTESIVREGIIDLEAIDKNKDGKVFQDMMDWNVISDEAGNCPVCEMKLKEVTIKEAEANLLKNGFEVKQ